MKEFDMKNGTCFGALTYAIQESKAMGLESGSQAYFDYVEKRKYEIWEQLEAKTYRFGAQK